MKRRSVLAGLFGVSFGAVLRGKTEAQTGQTGDVTACLAEPGIALFLDVFQGTSNLNFQELLPGAGWQLFSSPYSLVTFLYPPDWSAELLYAATFTENAAPIWTADVPQAGGLLSARVMSADATAAWEYVAGTFQGVAMSMEQAIGMAEGGMLGDGYTGNRLCIYTEPTMSGGSAWLTAIESNGLLLLTNGTLFADSSGFSPFSVITYYGMVAPRASYEQVMREVFIPIQWQLLRRGGEDAVATSTPTV